MLVTWTRKTTSEYILWMLRRCVKQPCSCPEAVFRTQQHRFYQSGLAAQEPCSRRSLAAAPASLQPATRLFSTSSHVRLVTTNVSSAAAHSMVACADVSSVLSIVPEATAPPALCSAKFACSMSSANESIAEPHQSMHQQQEQLQQLQDSMQQQEQLQQPLLTESACTYSTKLLHIDPAALPPATAPDAAAVQRLLSSSDAPDLSRSSCPHLYYMPGVQQVDGHSIIADSDSNGCSSPYGTQQPYSALQQAAEMLQQHLPVAIPTETVYGLAGNALSASAVASIFEAKGRPSDNPLIVHVSDLDMLYRLYPDCQAAGLNPIPRQYHRLVAAFWPGPLTILLPTSPLIPAAVTAGQPTVAVRMPAHPVARALIAAAGVPLAAPSANTSGKPSPTTAQHVLQDLDGRVPAVVDGGACGFGVESTVLDGLREPPVVLRPGGVTAEQLALSPEMAGLQVYSRDFTDKALEARPTTPGMKYRHYSPTAPVLLLDPSTAWQALQEQYSSMSEQQKQQSMQQLEQAMVAQTQQLLQQLHQQGQQQRVVLLSTCSSSEVQEQPLQPGWLPTSVHMLQLPTGCKQSSATCSAGGAGSTLAQGTNGQSSGKFEVLEYVLGSIHAPDVVAKELFAALRAADGVGCSVILAQGVLPVGAGMAVMNRLQKAASQRHSL